MGSNTFQGFVETFKELNNITNEFDNALEYTPASPWAETLGVIPCMLKDPDGKDICEAVFHVPTSPDTSGQGEYAARIFVPAHVPVGEGCKVEFSADHVSMVTNEGSVAEGTNTISTNATLNSVAFLGLTGLLDAIVLYVGFTPQIQINQPITVNCTGDAWQERQQDQDVQPGDSGNVFLDDGKVFALLGHRPENQKMAVYINAGWVLGLFLDFRLAAVSGEANRELPEGEWRQLCRILKAIHSGIREIGAYEPCATLGICGFCCAALVATCGSFNTLVKGYDNSRRICKSLWGCFRCLTTDTGTVMEGDTDSMEQNTTATDDDTSPTT